MFFGSQVIAIVLAVFFLHGNGRAITSTSNDNIERMLDLAVEELNTVLNETNERTTEREEKPADVLRLSEPVQSQFSSENMIQPEEASPVFRQKRSHEDPCYTGNYQTVQLASGGIKTFPICRIVSLTSCGSSIARYGKRKCVGSGYETVSVPQANGTNQTRVYPRKCSCAV